MPVPSSKNPSAPSDWRSGAFDYATRAACATDSGWCELGKSKFEVVDVAMAAARGDQADALFCLGGAGPAYIQAHADDWNAIAAIPRHAG